jgi:hypothetical protein
MHHVNFRSVPGTIVQVLGTIHRVAETIGRVPEIIGRVPITIGRVLRTIIRISGTIALIQPNLIHRSCLTDRSNMSDGLRLNNLSWRSRAAHNIHSHPYYITLKFYRCVSHVPSYYLIIVSL